MAPRDVDPEDLEAAFDELADDPDDVDTRDPAGGSGVGVAKGRSFGSDAGRIHGSKSDPVLVGGVGYPYLADLAVGTVVAHRIAESGPSGVAVADLSHTPVASVQTIGEGAHGSVLLVGAEKRGGELNDGEPSEEPGRIRSYTAADIEAPGHDEAVKLLGQGAMGLITVRNVIRVGQALDILPDATRAITVEPAYDSWGMDVDEFSEPVEAALEDVLAEVRAWIDQR